MDGLLLNTENLYTKVTNMILAESGRPAMPWSIKAQLQGRPGPIATSIFFEWAQLKISREEFIRRRSELHTEFFPSCGPLPGAPELLEALSTATTPSGLPIEVALATSSTADSFELKTAHLQDLFKYFPKDQKILGDDPRILHGRGKPAPDIYLVALESINARLRSEGKTEVLPDECLVFEDAVPGVEAGRRAGMRVVWIPQEELRREFAGKEEEILAGIPTVSGAEGEVVEEDRKVGKVGDGWGELRESIIGFDYARYGIRVKEYR
ncbi:unnamed protein product [Tuber melanosporum]|jgi:pseudouridine-5'-monophosphatase|uniref:(Perigord truffle) hypothetical protein n=1 Tax=Tuber melanosporum (strain Mel28) TaxID=656061 RepID=D5GMP2_TUBMM|nr:uncharacterized protein GSTUM_00010863001 [Tuber melanosporum]CAZ85785.1 unnamed protein product [Tuber melanosporum]